MSEPTAFEQWDTEQSIKSGHQKHKTKEQEDQDKQQQGQQ